MHRLLLLLLVILAITPIAIAQTTVVSGTVTDSGGQTWNNGTYKFTTQALGQASVTGTLTATGTYSISIPHTAATGIVGDVWQVSVCPAFTFGCFTSAPIIIIGQVQTLNFTPGAISLTIPSTPQQVTPVQAYSDSEITGGWPGFSYWNVTSLTSRQCTAVSAGTCSSWAQLPNSSGTATFTNINKVVYADQQAGATADVKIKNCLLALPTGGICDARGFGATTQTLSSSVTISGTAAGRQYLIGDPATKYQPGSSGLNAFFVEPGGVIDSFTLNCATQPSYSGIFVQNDTVAVYLNDGTTIQNIKADSSCSSVPTGTLVQLASTGSGAGVFGVSIRNIRGFGLAKGISYTASGNGGFVNGNHCEDSFFYLTAIAYSLTTPSGTSPAVSGNGFSNCDSEAATNPAVIGYSLVATVGTIQLNTSTPVAVWDSTTPVSITGAGAINNTWKGKWDGTISDGPNGNQFEEGRSWVSNSPFTINGLLTANGGVVNGINQDSKITLPNSDFEKTTVLPPPTWSLQGTPTITYETVSPAPNKKQSIKIASTAVNTGLTSNQFYSARPNDTYTIRGMAKSDGTGTAFLALTFADKNGAVISSLSTTTVSTSWTQLSVTGTAPATSVSVSVQLLNSNAASSSVWFDQISAGDVSIVGASLSAATFPNTIAFGAGIVASATFPTIAAAGCGGAAASIVSPSGTASFKINVGTTPTSACTFTMPTATIGWNCFATDITTNSTSVFLQKQTGVESTTSVTITNFSDVAAATAFVASDILKVACFAD